jgi:multicomponent Na+:H+ antiporter subunit E
LLRLDRLLWGLRAFVLLLLVWIVLDGVGDLGVAVVAAALGAALAAWLTPAVPVRLRLGSLPAFLGFFLIESFRGAADVAWRALRRDLPIDPHLVRYRVSLPPGPARTLLAGVVSLLPGTLTADASDDGGSLTVHAIAADPQRSVRALEARVAALYGVTLEDRP